MKRQKHYEEAIIIGHDSYSLGNFLSLPTTATAGRQIAALKADQRWQKMHYVEVSSRIDKLIQDIETKGGG